MLRLLIVFIFFFSGYYAFSQQSDFISFKKKGRTVTNYFKGTFIEFIHTNGSYVQGVINRINNDTLFMVFNEVRMLPTYWGTVVPDTMARYDMRFHYKEIAAIPKPQKGFEYVKDGTLLKIAGIGYGSLHAINALIVRDQEDRSINPISMAVAGGLTLTGFGLKKMRKYTYPIGNKYTIDYISIKTLP